MGGELGLHDVAGGAAELNGIHVLDGAITELAGDDHVGNRHHGEKDPRAAPGRSAILQRVQFLGDLALGQGNTDRNQRQPGEEDERNRDEDQQPDVRIADDGR